MKRAIEAVLLERREFRQGTRVQNCVIHSPRRPSECVLCLTDLENQLALALRVNQALNGWMDRLDVIVSKGAET